MGRTLLSACLSEGKSGGFLQAFAVKKPRAVDKSVCSARADFICNGGGRYCGRADRRVRPATILALHLRQVALLALVALGGAFDEL